jgi:hypothetical protein
MRSYLEHKEKKLFCEFVYDRDEDRLSVRSGLQGAEGNTEVIGYDEAMKLCGAPPGLAFDSLAEMMISLGYVKIVDPADLLRQVEGAQEVTLKGRIREFYESGEVLKYQNRHSREFDCRVNFDSRYAKLTCMQTWSVKLIPVAGQVDEKGYEDEQRWIGINPEEANSPVYELFTSSRFEEVFPDLDAFLADFV